MRQRYQIHVQCQWGYALTHRIVCVQEVWKWKEKDELHIVTARLIETLASPYHVVAALPPHCVSLLQHILGGNTSSAYLATQAQDYQLECPVIFDFLFKVAYHAPNGHLPETAFPLLTWLCEANALLFKAGACGSTPVRVFR